MKSKISSIFSYLWANKGKKRVWIPAIIVVIIILINIKGGSTKVGTYIYEVQPKEFVQTVSLTGKVIAAKNVDMAFELAGRVSRVNVKVGDTVKAGQVLASLENGDYASALQKNYALTLSENARLRDIQSGSKQADVSLANSEVEKAKQEVLINKQVFLDQLQDIYDKANDAVRSKIDGSFKNPRSSNPEFIYSIDQNTALRASLSMDRLKIGEMLTKWGTDITGDNLQNIRTYISATQKFIADANTAISIVAEKTGTNDFTYNEVITRKADINTARTSFATAVNAFNQADLAYNTSLNTLKLAEQRLAVKSKGTSTDLDIQRANVQSAAAGVQSAEAMLAKTVIRAPFDGIITKADIKVGEISSPNTPILAMLNDGEYQIETYVSENDVAKLAVNQPVRVTLDAYGRDVFFDAAIISVDPAETLKDGVSTYRTKIQFANKDERIKSGMTANIAVETDRRQNVFVIPQSAVTLDKGVKKVYVVTHVACVQKESEANTAITASPECAEAFEDKEDVAPRVIKTGEISNTGEIEVVEGIEAYVVLIYNIKAQ